MNTSNITNYKPKDFAELLGVSVKTLQRWDREGILPVLFIQNAFIQFIKFIFQCLFFFSSFEKKHMLIPYNLQLFLYASDHFLICSISGLFSSSCPCASFMRRSASLCFFRISSLFKTEFHWSDILLNASSET